MLRIILLILGILIILGIAFDGLRRKRQRLKKAQSHIITSDAEQIAADEAIATADEELELEHDLPTEIEAGLHEDNVINLNDKTTADASGPHDLNIAPVSFAESANQDLPTEPKIEPHAVQSANEKIRAKPKQVEQPQKAESAPEVISLTIMSTTSRPFAGYDLIKALEDTYCHYGEHNIYHRYKYKNGKGPLLFSIASVVKPGTIDPKRVGDLSTPGLAMFMQLDNPKHDRMVFKQILATAHQLAKTLGGVVCDERRVPLREVTIKVYEDKLGIS